MKLSIDKSKPAKPEREVNHVQLFTNRVVRECRKIGRVRVELQLEYFQNYKNAILPITQLSREEIIECYKTALKIYRAELLGPPYK